MEQSKENNDSSSDLENWLESLNLKDEYFEVFNEEGFNTMEAISLLQEEDLKEMGVTKFAHKKKILSSIESKENNSSSVLENWLESLNLKDEYFEVFSEEGFDTMEDISLLQAEDLKEMGVTKLAHRKKILSSIESKENNSSSVLENWLESLNLKDEYYEVFSEEGFDTMEDISLLQAEDLKEMGVTKFGHRKKILSSIEKINAKETETTANSELPIPPITSTTVISPPTVPIVPSAVDDVPTDVQDDIKVKLCNIKNGDYKYLNGTFAKIVGYDKESNKFSVILLDGKDEHKDEHSISRDLFTSNLITEANNTFAGYPEYMATQIRELQIVACLPRKLGIQWLPRANKCQTIVFVGPTGSGKSRLINYLLGEDLLESASSLQSVTKSIDACSVLKTSKFNNTVEYFLVDTVGLMDTKLSNKDVLQLATDGIKKGFKTMNSIVFVLRNGRVEPAQMEAIQQAIDWFNLEDENRKGHVIVVITHCDTFSRQASEEIIERYKKHKIIGKLYKTRTLIDKTQNENRSFEFNNFFCIGLPDLSTLDEEDMLPIFTKRLREQKAALNTLMFSVSRRSITPVEGTIFDRFKDNCSIM